MSVTVKRSKTERANEASQNKLQKEFQVLTQENKSLKLLIKQKDARLAALSASFDSSSIPQNVVEAFDMESMFRQAAIDAQEHVQRLLKTVQIKPEDFEEVKAKLDKTTADLAQTRKENTHMDKQLKFQKKENKSLLEELRSLTVKLQALPDLKDFRSLEDNYRGRIIALKGEIKKKDFLLGQYTNTLPSILSKDHTSAEYQKLEEELHDSKKIVASLSCVVSKNEELKANILQLERERDDLKDCITSLKEETEDLKKRVEDHEAFEKSLPPDSKTSAVLQQELIAKDLSLKRQHSDFVKQLNDMNDTVTYLRLQYEKHKCVQHELARKTEQLKKLKEENELTKEKLDAKEQQIKDIEGHFVVRRSGLQHTITSLDKKIQSMQEELSDNKRNISKLMSENKKLTQQVIRHEPTPTPVESVNAESVRDIKIEAEFYKQQLLDQQQALRNEKRQRWKANDKIKQLEIACHDAFDKLVLKEEEMKTKKQRQRVLLDRKDRTINELRKLSLKTDYSVK